MRVPASRALDSARGGPHTDDVRIGLAVLIASVWFHPAVAQEAPPLTPATLAVADRAALERLGAYGLRDAAAGPTVCRTSPIPAPSIPGVTVCDPRTGLDLTAADVAALLALPAAGDAPPAKSAAAAVAPPSPTLAALRGGKIFEPMGALPAGEYSGSLRPAMSGDNVAVTPAGRTQAALGVRADNFLTRMSGPDGSVVQKFENQAATIDLRRGLNVSRPTEIGVQVRILQRNEGIMNGLISGWEHLTSKAFSDPSLINPDRSGPNALLGTQDVVAAGGRASSHPGNVGPTLGDVTFTAKTAVLEAVPGSFMTSIAARAAVNLATGGVFSTGPWAGVGVGAQRRVIGALYANADLRVTQPLAARDARGLPLTRSAGGTVGLEYGVNDKTSVGVQVDAQTSPYRKTGVRPLDDTYADVTFGISRAANVFSQKVVIRVWGKEDFNPNAPRKNLRLNPHGDTDFQAGASITVTR